MWTRVWSSDNFWGRMKSVRCMLWTDLCCSRVLREGRCELSGTGPVLFLVGKNWQHQQYCNTVMILWYNIMILWYYYDKHTTTSMHTQTINIPAAAAVICVFKLTLDLQAVAFYLNVRTVLWQKWLLIQLQVWMIIVVNNVNDQLQVWSVNSQTFRTLAFRRLHCTSRVKLDILITMYIVASSI